MRQLCEVPRSSDRRSVRGLVARLVAMNASGAVCLAACAALAAAGCGAQDDPTSGVELDVVRSALTTTNGGQAYAQQCVTDGVPLPPVWGASTIGANWQGPTHFTDGFLGQAGDVYFSNQTNGLCVIAAHDDGPFDVICQGTNGKACFWEGPTMVTPPSPFLVIASTTGSYSQGGIAGGNDLNKPGTQHCTACHAGQNVFIGHNAANHALNLLSKRGWMPDNNVYYDPIEPAGWPNAGPSTTNYPATCTTCHNATGVAGAFPRLDTAQFGGEFYCSVLSHVTHLPGDEGGMPPTAVCGQDHDGTPCAADSDPAVKKMLALCGGPNPPVPLSISGLGAPGIGSQFLAARRHISASVPGEHQHYFYNAPTTMPNAGCCAGQSSHPVLKPADKIEVSVYLPTDDPPLEVMIQVYNGSSWYRVFWGAQILSWPGSYMGALPQTGTWTTLSFTPSNLGLPANSVLSGMAFTLYNGSASWSDVLFRSSDSGYNGQYVSQMWVGDHEPLGATTTADGGDSWTWQPYDLAEYTTAYTSTTLGGGVASRGVDGNDDGNWYDGSVFHTDATTDSSYLGLGAGGDWWYVDMGAPHTVRRVVLYNRTDCCMDRLSHFRINYWDPSYGWRIASDQSNTITSAANPVIPINFADITTQYIMVQKADHNYLHLAEVEVYGDP